MAPALPDAGASPPADSPPTSAAAPPSVPVGDPAVEARPPATAPGPPWKAIATVLAVLLVGLGAFVLLRSDDDDTASPPTSTTVAAEDLVTVEDEAAGFTIAYPKTWKAIRPAEGEERLLLTVGGQSYFQLKVRTADPATVSQEIQSALADLEMLTEPRQVTLNGMPASLYLYYTPVTESSPEKGVHVHYFVLSGDRLYSMVFQALPAEELNDLVPVFDRVAKSLKITGASATTPTTGAGSAPTTGAGATTTAPR